MLTWLLLKLWKIFYYIPYSLPLLIYNYLKYLHPRCPYLFNTTKMIKFANGNTTIAYRNNMKFCSNFFTLLPLIMYCPLIQKKYFNLFLIETCVGFSEVRVFNGCIRSKLKYLQFFISHTPSKTQVMQIFLNLFVSLTWSFSR